MNLPSLTQLKFLVNENSTTILTVMGVTGTVTTAYLTGRSTFRAAEVLAEEKKRLEARSIMEGSNGSTIDVLTTKGKVKLVWPFYIPPITVGIITIASIIMANKIASGKVAALTLASQISERALQEYKDKVAKKLTERQAIAVRDEIAQDRVNANPVEKREVIITGGGDVLCMDMLTGRYFNSTIEEIKRAENVINHELNNFMSASLSQFYDEIGLPATNYSDSVGWNANNMVEVLFSTTMSSDSRPCIAVDFNRPPHPDYKNLHD